MDSIQNHCYWRASYASGSTFYLTILIKICFRLVPTLASQVEVTLRSYRYREIIPICKTLISLG